MDIMIYTDHPMTGLWPWGKLNRHMTFRARMRATQTELFKAYEDLEGVFNGPEVDQHLVGRKKKRRTKTVSSSDEDDDSMDSAFV